MMSMRNGLGLFVALLASWGCTPGAPSQGGAAAPGAPQAAELPGAVSTAAAQGAREAPACPVGQLPGLEQLPANPKLPDPFRTLAGQRITKKSEWACRRAEIGAQLAEYELGPKPPRPRQQSAKLIADRLEVTVGDGQKSVTFAAQIELPPNGKAPYPALIGLGRASLDAATLAKLGVAFIKFPNSDVAEQDNGQSRGKGAFYALHGSDHPAGAMMAWAWGVSSLIDVLETTPDTKIDAKRLGVTGCSRNGKGALVAGAFDDRIALTIPQESGAGGSASWRVSDKQRLDWQTAGSPAGQDVQTLRQITKENVWFRSSFAQFSESADKLPFDHHMLMGMVAPRALLVVENTSMHWLGKVSSFTTGMVAHRIWQALGVPERMGFTQTGDHDHCQYAASQVPELEAYLQRFLVGGAEPDTKVMKTDGGFTLDEARWVDWATPALE
jgi:hypothetical protein